MKFLHIAAAGDHFGGLPERIPRPNTALSSTPPTPSRNRPATFPTVQLSARNGLHARVQALYEKLKIIDLKKYP
jgi:hypothetical protein